MKIRDLEYLRDKTYRCDSNGYNFSLIYKCPCNEGEIELNVSRDIASDNARDERLVTIIRCAKCSKDYKVSEDNTEITEK